MPGHFFLHPRPGRTESGTLLRGSKILLTSLTYGPLPQGLIPSHDRNEEASCPFSAIVFAPWTAAFIPTVISPIPGMAAVPASSTASRAPNNMAQPISAMAGSAIATSSTILSRIAMSHLHAPIVNSSPSGSVLTGKPDPPPTHDVDIVFCLSSASFARSPHIASHVKVMPSCVLERAVVYMRQRPCVLNCEVSPSKVAFVSGVLALACRV